ncbi:MAG: nicotinate (nicotinamide) nucleotide adenylyltransferase [Candidatus Aquilonibacter sp.]|jgi:nicotinate-nucleotide adenylyltransferase
MRLGIFGGTFDPIHNAHLFLAESARTLENLDRVLFVPTKEQKHYRNSAQEDAAHRCAMILAGIEGNAGFALDESDLRADATGYTADLLPLLKKKYPKATFTFIIGADSLANSPWERFDEVLEQLERFVIAPRIGVRPEALQRVIAAVPKSLRERIATLNMPELTESATLVRTLLSQGRSVRYLVPEAVWQYIVAHGLYGIER